MKRLCRGLPGIFQNHYNNSLAGWYRSGWTYHRFTIGTPLITSAIFNERREFGLENNRVTGHHIGFEGHITENLRYRNLLTFSCNCLK
ncbi:MAG: hypothetical protein R6U58_11655 [Bacteroidales bacterium]